MMSLYEAVNAQAKTDNGAKAHFSSLSKCLDLFYLAGASRGKDIKQEFRAALVENPELALRILQWLRDIRGGAGERQLFRDLLLVAADTLALNNIDGSKSVSQHVIAVISKIPEIGRFDDLLWLLENAQIEQVRDFALHVFVQSLRELNGLAFKWTPIKGETAKKLRKVLGFKQEKEWRKYVVAGRKTVEQKMCAKEWGKIEFDKIPSVASARYQKAFGRNAQERYAKYLESLQKGETTINTSAVYPYDVYKSVYNGNPDIAEQQWNALPNYMEDSDERILALIDVSSSMNKPVGGNNTITCMDAAISLGWYIASRSTGTFKDVFMTFESSPRLLKVDTGTLKQRFDLIRKAPWAGSTNIAAAFKLILDAAVDVKLDPSQMPTTLVILSDMQFDCSNVEGKSATAFNTARAIYQSAGYEMPKLVFWNLNASNKTAPVTKSDTGTVMVSGLSPAILKGVLGKGNNPEEVMLETIMIERYAL